MTNRQKAILWGTLAPLTLCFILTFSLSFYLPIPMYLLYFVVLNLLVFVNFGQDKWAAENDKARTPEMSFHILGFLGGFPAIFLGRKFFKHKTQKKSYIQMMWAFFILQIIAVIYLFNF